MPNTTKTDYETQRITFVIPTSRVDLLRAEAQRREISVSELLRRLIDVHFNQKNWNYATGSSTVSYRTSEPTPK